MKMLDPESMRSNGSGPVRWREMKAEALQSIGG